MGSGKFERNLWSIYNLRLHQGIQGFAFFLLLKGSFRSITKISPRTRAAEAGTEIAYRVIYLVLLRLLEPNEFLKSINTK